MSNADVTNTLCVKPVQRNKNNKYIMHLGGLPHEAMNYEIFYQKATDQV